MPYFLLSGVSLFLIGMLSTSLKMVTPEDREAITDECIKNKCDYLKYIEHGNFNFY